MENQERIQRVVKMEALMDQTLAAATSLSLALDAWEAAGPGLKALREYYGGPLWREDFEADEAGKLPRELKRGVLSEDGLYDLLTWADALNDVVFPEPDIY